MLSTLKNKVLRYTIISSSMYFSVLFFFYNGNFYSPQGFSVYKVLAAWNLSKHKMQKGRSFCQLFGSLSSDTALTENASQIILSLLYRICNVRFIVCTTQTAENLGWGFYCPIFLIEGHKIHSANTQVITSLTTAFVCRSVLILFTWTVFW